MSHRSSGHEPSRTPALSALGIILLTRTTLNSSYRVVYPFLPAIGRGLGVSLTAVSFLLTVRAFAGLSSPLFGPLSDRRGRRAMMLGGLMMLVIGAALLALAGEQFRLSAYPVAFLAFALLGIAKVVYDPALQAYLGDLIPYQRRGRIMALVELSWSAAWLLGVPATGFLIDLRGWQAPFVAISILGLLSFFLTRRLPKADHARSLQVDLPSPALLRNRSALAALVVSILFMFANENVFVVYGAWMESNFGLSVSALGVASVVIGVSELVAEGATAAFVDRIGKKRAVAGSALLTVGAYLLLPALTGSLAVALLGLAALFITFEFSVVSSIPLVSELSPTTRGTLMALNVAAMSAGRMAGSLTATLLWLRGGMVLNGAVSAGASLVALLVLVLLVREGG